MLEDQDAERRSLNSGMCTVRIYCPSAEDVKFTTPTFVAAGKCLVKGGFARYSPLASRKLARKNNAEDSFRSRRFPGVDVCHDADIACFFEWEP